MLVYGDEIAIFKGIVRQKRETAFDIYFSDLQEETWVPKFVLKKPIDEEVGVEQDITMPLWYMRKNRLIPRMPGAGVSRNF